MKSSAGRALRLGSVAAVALVLLGGSGAVAQVGPDVVFLHGHVITVDQADSIAEAVAVKDGLITAVGTSGEIGAMVAPGTEVIDLAGRTVTPGLIDSHTHPMYYGQVEQDYVNLRPPAVTSIADIVARIAERISVVAPGEWVIGDGFFRLSDNRLPNRGDVDPVSSSNPVFLNSIGGHFGVANGKALEVAGIDRDTPDPVGGIIDRDPDTGEPTGILWNHPAMDLVRRHYPPFEIDDLVRDVDFAQQTYAEHGVTSFQDVNVRTPLRLHAYEAAEDRLNLRGFMYFTVEREQDAEWSMEQTELYRRPTLSYGGNKFLLDGQPPTSYTYEPHPGPSYDEPTWEADALNRVVSELHADGRQLAFHVMGDAAIDMALDAIEEAVAEHPRGDHRHRLEHAMIPTRDAIARIKRLGVVVSAQPGAIYSGGDTYLAIWGPERIKRLMPLRSLLDAGITVALGSDFPTVPELAPQRGLWEAVARRTSSGVVLAPQEAISIQEALRAHTMGSAYATHEDDIKGSIEVGKLADMAVWSGDLYAVPLDEIRNLTIVATVVGGRVVAPSPGEKTLYLPLALEGALPHSPAPVHPPPDVPTATPTPPNPTPPNPTAPPILPRRGIVVDHTSVAEFARLPDAAIDAAAALRMVYVDASVGANISDGLDCLSYPSTAEAPSRCKRANHVAPEFSVDPSVLAWQRPGGYPRANWGYLTWSGGCTDWTGKVSCFLHQAPALAADRDVVSFQFSYLEVAAGSTIADPASGFFATGPVRHHIADLEAFEAQHPGTVVLYWTTSLARGIGTPEAEEFNAQMRAYAAAHGKPLFDVADILSHDVAGHPCYDNRDGVPYSNGNQSEDYPDDGRDLAAICQQYTTEVDGGHLGSVSAGKIRVAKAMWVLMARVAGWGPYTGQQLPFPHAIAGLHTNLQDRAAVRKAVVWGGTGMGSWPRGRRNG